MGFENIGRVWTSDSLRHYLETKNRPGWIKAIVLHHTKIPSLAMRSHGFTIQHIINIADFYRQPKENGGMGWNSGPHLFVDEDQIFGMCDFHHKGVHARSFNATSLGIEILGNYDKENPLCGRGLQCWLNAVSVVRVLLNWLGLEVSKKTILFHRQEPDTIKSCPGKLVDKEWVLQLISSPDEQSINLPEKPALDFQWDAWAFRNGKWNVPLYDFLRQKGVPADLIKANLSIQAGEVFYNDKWLPGGYYIAAGSFQQPDDCTWIPVEEVLQLV